MNTTKKNDTFKLAFLGILSAIVFVLQFFVKIPLGGFTISVSLSVIVLAAVLYGYTGGALIGGVSAVAILLNGDAALFYSFNFFLTVVVVLAKGIASGVAAAAVYKLIKKLNQYVAVVIAAIVCPIVNTGLFFLGSLAFFYGNIQAMAGGTNVALFIIVGFIGLNFIVELIANVVLAPIIVKLIKMIPSTQKRF